MNIAYSKGDFECHSWNVLENFIKESSSHPFEDIWLYGTTEYPCLAILINGDNACVHYFLNDQGDMWQSAGNGDKDVVFVSNGVQSAMPADSVIPLDQAVECAKQFYDAPDRPDCIDWREL